MNTIQKLTRVVGIGLLLVMGLFPPWRLRHELTNDQGATSTQSVAKGYYPLWSPPSEELPEGASNGRYQIDLLRLGAQFIGVLVVINAGILLMKKKTS